MTGQNTNNLSDAIRNLIVCDTQFGWTGDTTLKLPELLDLQARGWLIEGDENNEFSLTTEGESVVARALQRADERATPSANWSAEGQPDPHGRRYVCERAALTLGNLTDDELANAVFLHGNEQPAMADLAAGKALTGIVYLTAAKDRIRWLSRALADATAPQPAELAEQQGVDLPPLPASSAHDPHTGEPLFSESKMRMFANAALAATGKQQAGENPAWRDELVREAHARGLMEGLDSPRPQQVGEVQGDALLPCPFCGSEDAEMQQCQAEHYVQCLECEGATALFSSRREARELWNRRVTLAARQPGAQVPVGFQIMRRSADDTCFNGRWDNPPAGFHDDREYFSSSPGRFRVRDIYAAPPAQGIDLGQQRPLIARSLAEWHENDGNVMWWAWCGRGWAGEPAWCGTPNDSDWPGYHTHWTQHPSQPALIDQRDAAPGVGNGPTCKDPLQVASCRKENGNG